MARHIGILLQGLAVMVPALFTFWVLWAMVSWLDGHMGALLKSIPYLETFPGLGILVAFVIIYIVGLLTRLWLFRKGFGFAEKLIRRVPLIKTLYGSVRDMLQFFGGNKKKSRGEAVQVNLGEMGYMIGVSTSALADDGERIGVYLPLSYQIGGFLIYMPRTRVTSAGMSVEEALKLVLTGGMGVQVDEESTPT
jgi:uncharacterized membrane protein